MNVLYVQLTHAGTRTPFKGIRPLLIQLTEFPITVGLLQIAVHEQSHPEVGHVIAGRLNIWHLDALEGESMNPWEVVADPRKVYVVEVPPPPETTRSTEPVVNWTSAKDRLRLAVGADDRVIELSEALLEGTGVGHASGKPLILYCRQQFRSQWDALSRYSIENEAITWVVGPPGTGKTCTTLAFAYALDSSLWDILWISFGREDEALNCMWLRGDDKLVCVVRMTQLELLKQVLDSTSKAKTTIVFLDGYVSSNEYLEHARMLCKEWHCEVKSLHRLVYVCALAEVNKHFRQDIYRVISSASRGVETGEAEEAHYAYEAAAGQSSVTESARPVVMGTAKALTNGGEVSAADSMDIDDVSDSGFSGYVGSSAPSQDGSYAATPGSEFPFSLASDVDTTEHSVLGVSNAGPSANPAEQVSSTVKRDHGAEDSPGHASQLSQEGFIMGSTEYATGMPQQLPTFLRQFQGTLIAVPANGQCAYAALYATTSYVEGGKLTFSSEVVRGANAIKRSVYTLMMANLARDVECGVVEPHCELQRLYPKQAAPSEPQAATAMLYAHYAQERARSVNTSIPSEFWAGAEVLRAMAQYLREPLIVFDVDAHNDAHVQRYYYKEYITATGGTHETGCGGALDDVSALELLKQHALLHVLPVMMVIKRHEGHFYGLHHGDISTRWQAEGDRHFTETHCSTHDWYGEVMAHITYSEDKLLAVDTLEDSNEVDLIIVGGMEHRARLDVVHDRMALPRLNGDAFDIAAMEAALGAEGDRIRRAAGSSASDREAGNSEGHRKTPCASTSRYPITQQGRIALEPLQRILDSINLEPELLLDRKNLSQLLQANSDAMRAWLSMNGRIDGLPGMMAASQGTETWFPWFLTNRKELHSLFRYLPYPELAAKQIQPRMRESWGGP